MQIEKCIFATHTFVMQKSLIVVLSVNACRRMVWSIRRVIFYKVIQGKIKGCQHEGGFLFCISVFFFLEFVLLSYHCLKSKWRKHSKKVSLMYFPKDYKNGAVRSFCFKLFSRRKVGQKSWYFPDMFLFWCITHKMLMLKIYIVIIVTCT